MSWLRCHLLEDHLFYHPPSESGGIQSRMSSGILKIKRLYGISQDSNKHMTSCNYEIHAFGSWRLYSIFSPLHNTFYTYRLLSTITEPTAAGLSEPPSIEETPPTPLVVEESDMDKVEHGMKKVCFKVSEEDQEDSGHDTMSYRDSYRWVSRTQKVLKLFLMHIREDKANVHW